MLRTDVERKLLDERFDDGYLDPDYAEYSFANVNPEILGRLGADTERSLPDDVFDDVGGGFEQVVTVFLDGYGWDRWTQDCGEMPLLSALTERGQVTPLTAVYPSETTAATRTFHTGRTPVEHGLLGWWQYVDSVDDVVKPLPFVTADGEPMAEAHPDCSRSDLSAGDSIYERAEAEGVETHLHQPFPATGPETGATETTQYRNVADLARRLRRGLEDPTDAAYQYGYVPNVDAAGHRSGTESDDFRAQLAMVCGCLRRELVDRLDADTAERTLFVLIADHGQVDTVPGEYVDIGAQSAPDVWDDLRRDGRGDPIPPVGSPRNVHLFLQAGTVERVRQWIESRFPCRTYTREEALASGLFGDRDPSDLFRRRCGDLVVVHRDQGVWWDGSEVDRVGMHGGLTRAEMLVPFATARLDALRS